MKKIICLFLIAITLFTLGGCGKSTPKESGSSSSGENPPDVPPVIVDEDDFEYTDDTPDFVDDKPTPKATPENFNPTTDSPYITEDVVKPNLMWNTAELFAKEIEQKEVGACNLGERLTSFKYKGAEYKGNETWNFAVIGTPDETVFAMPSGGYPAMILVHGGGGQVFTDWIKYWNDKGYVAVALDIFGNMLNTSGAKTGNAEGGPKEHDGPIFDDVETPTDSWIYHNVYNVITLNNMLRARNDVNENKIGMTGISWGSVVTEVVSGVDKRFACFAPVYGSGYLYDDSTWAKGTFGGEAGSEGRSKWIELYDPSSYLPYATKPMMFVSGFNDNCFSATNRMKSTKLCPGKVFYSQRSDLDHGHLWNKTYEIYAFAEHIMNGADTLSNIGYESEIKTVEKFKNQIVTFTFADRKFDSVKLIYTTSTSANSHDWTFKTRLVSFRNGWCTLPEGTTAYAIEFIADGISENFRQSTPIFIIENN